MAQTKTDYGLIYNDDGSVCTTVRQDQTPFVGVNSFAVETGTTNYVLFPVSFSTSPAGVSIEYLDDYTAKVTVTDATQITEDTDILFNGGRTVDANTTVTISEYVESTNTSNILPRVKGFGHMTDHEGKRYYKTITHHSSWHFQVGVQIRTPVVNGDYIIVSYPQIEIKPFASSFVVGSRPKGRLVIPVEDLKFDIANDDWVISYWKYPVATSDDTQNSYNLCSLGQNTSDKSKGYITWGKAIDMNKYRLSVVLNDATYIGNSSDNTFNPADYFFHWHYEVMKKQGKVLSYYVDAVKQVEHTIPANKKLQTPFDVGLSLGGFTSNNVFVPNNALIANVGNGKLQPGEFTDEHIMTIYEANRAFAQKGGVKIY